MRKKPAKSGKAGRKLRAVKAAKASTRRASTKRAKPQSRKPAVARRTRQAATTADIEFRMATVVRGEAQPADVDGGLPSGATHELKGVDKEGVPIIERKRFSVS